MIKPSILFTIAFATLVTSCLRVENKPLSTQTFSLGANNELQEIWRKDNIFIGSNGYRTNIDVESGVLVVLGNYKAQIIGSSILGLRSTDGEELWKIPREGGGEFAVQDSVLYNGSAGSPYLQAYEAKTGDFLWKTQLGWTKGVIDLFSYGENIFAFTNNDDLFEVTKEGEIVNIFRDSHRVYAIIDNIIFKEAPPLSIKAIDVSSSDELWELKLNSTYTFAPIFNKKDVFLFTNGSVDKIYSINRLSGNINWAKNYSILSNLVVAYDRVYFLEAKGYLIALNINTGSEILDLQFSPLIDPDKNINEYFVALDIENNILIIYLGDAEQIIAYKLIGD